MLKEYIENILEYEIKEVTLTETQMIVTIFYDKTNKSKLFNTLVRSIDTYKFQSKLKHFFPDLSIKVNLL